jgi:polyisoprenoid-binding protein YceI
MPAAKEMSVSRKATTIVISLVVAAGALFALTYFVIFPLAAHGKLPFQPQPTRIPVTAFAGLNTPAATTVSVAATTAPAATPSTAPTAVPTTGATAAATAYPASTTAATVAAPATATTAATTAAGSATAGTTAATGGTTFTIVADQSQAQVTVSEKFARLPSNTDAVLTTNAMQGQIVLGPDTKPTNASKIQVDLRTLKSDDSGRDNFIRRNTLQSDQFPVAEYVITGVEQWPGPLQNGQQATFKLVGMMTIHGVTKPITFDTTATMTGDGLSGTAKTAFTFQDFGMTTPSTPIVKATDTINLVMTITAKKAA